jgi:SAM-dependent methyltransferase
MKSDRQEALHRPEAARIVVTRYSLHHLLAPLSPLREMARVCVPDGRIVVVDAYARTPHCVTLNVTRSIRYLSRDLRTGKLEGGAWRGGSAWPRRRGSRA